MACQCCHAQALVPPEHGHAMAPHCVCMNARPVVACRPVLASSEHFFPMLVALDGLVKEQHNILTSLHFDAQVTFHYRRVAVQNCKSVLDASKATGADPICGWIDNGCVNPADELYSS